MTDHNLTQGEIDFLLDPQGYADERSGLAFKATGYLLVTKGLVAVLYVDDRNEIYSADLTEEGEAVRALEASLR